jgi:epoxyqueuosine reductase
LIGGRAVKEELRSILIESGADVCGFARMDRFEAVPKDYHPRAIWEGCETAIVFGVALPKGLFEIQSRLVYARSNDVSVEKVDSIAYDAALAIERDFPVIAIPVPCDTPYEFWDADSLTGRGLVNMKRAAFLAGLGSIGKSQLLINRTFGNRLTLGMILVDAALESDDVSPELCRPGCSICVKGCPAGAIGDTGVDQKKCRQHTYGKTARGFDTVECYRCRSLCPLKYGVA